MGNTEEGNLRKRYEIALGGSSEVQTDQKTLKMKNKARIWEVRIKVKFFLT
jgi:hypothetical protein